VKTTSRDDRELYRFLEGKPAGENDVDSRGAFCYPHKNGWGCGNASLHEGGKAFLPWEEEQLIRWAYKAKHKTGQSSEEKRLGGKGKSSKGPGTRHAGCSMQELEVTSPFFYTLAFCRPVSQGLIGVGVDRSQREKR